ncbi:MAG: hypothetical protein KIS92_09920 [Planctomycetota bacterium]|nr:hypothetical protein [Planctomycetota bacterium]
MRQRSRLLPGFGLCWMLGALVCGAQEAPPLPPERPAEPAPVAPAPGPLETKSLDPSALDETKRPAQTSPEEDDDLTHKDPLQSAEIMIGRKDAVPVPEVPKTLCETCHDTGRIRPRLLLPYVLFENDPAPEPDAFLGWKPCEACKRGLEMKQVYEDEKTRQAKRGELYAGHEKAMHMAFLDFETRHATGHFQTSAAEARECAKHFEKLTIQLKEHCQGDAFLKATPQTQHMVVCENGEKYATYLEWFAKTRHDKDGDPNWQDLAKTTSSFGSRNLTVIRRDALVVNSPQGLGHLTTFVLAQMLVHEATDGKAPLWFCEGFSSLCESLIFETPWCYSIRYEQNKLNFDASWAQAIAKGIRERKTQAWEVIFTREMISMPQLEYQQCWSIVRYLYKLDGLAFAKLPELFKKGLDSKKAFEEAYGKPIATLEANWKAWAAQGR